MEKNSRPENEIRQISLSDSETIVELDKMPSMAAVFFKALLVAPFRSTTVSNHAAVEKIRIVFKNYQLNPERIRQYKTICGFASHDPDVIPITYFQTLFNSLAGYYITSSFFPLTPLGLIHIFQSAELKIDTGADETVDLCLSLAGMTRSTRGIETSFRLEVIQDDDIVWLGNFVVLTKKKGENQGKKREWTEKRKEGPGLPEREHIDIPAGTGRRYARVSGDYNPHHLFDLTARIFGFKRAIAHGMWSFARSVAGIETGLKKQVVKAKAAFKLPVFIPAEASLGFEENVTLENPDDAVHFELRDRETAKPHLKGKIWSR